jgi:hypothetical protein
MACRNLCIWDRVCPRHGGCAARRVKIIRRVLLRNLQLTQNRWSKLTRIKPQMPIGFEGFRAHVLTGKKTPLARPPPQTATVQAAQTALQLYACLNAANHPREIPDRVVMSPSLRARIEIFESAAATKCASPRGDGPSLVNERKTPSRSRGPENAIAAEARAFRDSGAPKIPYTRPQARR